MSKPEQEEVLFAYIIIASHAVSLVLDDDGVQRPVYYVSKSLDEAQIHYLSLERAIMVVVHATWKLPHYFQAHTVMVLTQLPLRSLLWKVDYTRRVAKNVMILGAFDIKYMPHTSIKGQVLADLVTEFAEPSFEENGERQSMDGKLVRMISLQEPLSWKVYVDSTVNQRGSRVGLVLVSPKMIIIEKSLRLGFSATNNEAKYEALLVGMAIVQKMGGRTMEKFSDSRLVVGQIKGELEAKDVRMQEYLNQARHLQSVFDSFSLHQIPKSKNMHADSLATLTTSPV